MLSLTATHLLHPPLPRLPGSSSPPKNPFLANPSRRGPKPATLSKSAPDPIFSSPTEPDFEPEPDPEPEPVPVPEPEVLEEVVSVEDGFEIEIEIEKAAGKKNRRVIRSRIRVDADLETVWGVLTDYEGLADFLPGLAVSQLMEKADKFARLYQVGQQELALGLKFDARGVLECYERDIEYLPSGRRRDIEFKMVEGDFQTFEGRWSIEQIDKSTCSGGEFAMDQEFQTTLSYVVELEPKFWLPVRLLEGRLCNEVKTNILCVREEAQRVQKLGATADTLTLPGRPEKSTLNGLVDDES